MGKDLEGHDAHLPFSIQRTPLHPIPYPEALCAVLTVASLNAQANMTSAQQLL